MVFPRPAPAGGPHSSTCTFPTEPDRFPPPSWFTAEALTQATRAPTSALCSTCWPAPDTRGSSIDYRTAPEFRFPQAADDVSSAIQWVKVNAATYRVDVAKIALIGESAGGFLVNDAGTHETPETRGPGKPSYCSFRLLILPMPIRSAPAPMSA